MPTSGGALRADSRTARTHGNQTIPAQTGRPEARIPGYEPESHPAAAVQLSWGRAVRNCAAETREAGQDRPVMAAVPAQ